MPRKPSRRELALIHGWGFDRRVWSSFIPLLQDDWRVHCVDLPGYGPGCCGPECGQGYDDTPPIEKQTSIEAVAEFVSRQIPEHADVLAWSLGGLVATHIRRHRIDLQAMILLASSPCFVNKDGWAHGVEAVAFKELEYRLSLDRRVALRKFSALVAMGERNSRETIARLSALMENNIPDLETLQAGLKLLSIYDLRSVWQEYDVIDGLIFGANDTLVKSSIVDSMPMRSRVAVIEGAGHAPFLTCPYKVAEALRSMILEQFDDSKQKSVAEKF